MEVKCPLCNGPATQPIMQIYCKNECDKKSKIDGLIERYRISTPTLGYRDYEVWSSPPPSHYITFAKKYSWVLKSSNKEDYIKRTAEEESWWSLTQYNYWENEEEYKGHCYGVFRIN